jgi:hypothetical protein
METLSCRAGRAGVHSVTQRTTAAEALSLRLVRHCHHSGRMNLDSVIEVSDLYSGLVGDIRVRLLRWKCLTRRRDKWQDQMCYDARKKVRYIFGAE